MLSPNCFPISRITVESGVFVDNGIPLMIRFDERCWRSMLSMVCSQFLICSPWIVIASSISAIFRSITPTERLPRIVVSTGQTYLALLSLDLLTWFYLWKDFPRSSWYRKNFQSRLIRYLMQLRLLLDGWRCCYFVETMNFVNVISEVVAESSAFPSFLTWTTTIFFCRK